MSDIRCFEDFTPGEQFDCGARVVSAPELIAFATRFDPQPFHLDAEAAAATPLRGLALSGWHTASIAMRLYYEAALRGSTSLGAPGLDYLRWSAPARPDRPIRVTLDVLGARESRSRPEIGFVTMETKAFQDDVSIMQYRFSAMMARRGFEEAPKRPADRMRAEEVDVFAAARPAQEMRFARAADAPMGVAFDLGATTFSAEEIVEFAAEFDPQPFHLDRAAGAASVFGGLAASGWHSCAAWMRKFVDGVGAAIAANPTEAAAIRRFYGPSPGVEPLRWLLPVLEGDTLRFFSRAVAIEELPARPDWVFLVAENGAINQFGARVFDMRSRMMVRRDATATSV